MMMLLKKLNLSLTSLIALVVACVSLLSASAEDVSGAFDQANRLYERQNFREAAAAYTKILESGNNLPAVYFNLGNAHFKAGETGKAIAAYRAAAKLTPRDPDVQANLSLARDAVQNAKAPKSNLWTQLLDRLTLNEWCVIASACVAVTFLLLAFGQLKREWAKPVRMYATLTGMLGMFFIVCAILAGQRQFAQNAVIAVDEAVVRRGPFDESQSAFTLRDGAELTVIDKRDQWVQVTDTSNRSGWVKDKQVVLIK